MNKNCKNGQISVSCPEISTKVKLEPSAITSDYFGNLPEDINSSLRQSAREQILFNFMSDMVARLKQMGKYRTSETYQATLRSFMRFRENKDLPFHEMDSDMMLMYEAWLQNRRLCKNTTSFYMRILRAVYNRAVEKNPAINCHPFKHVYTGVDRTIKRAIPLQSIKKIKALDLSSHPSLNFARDIFLFSFYTRGMSFIDIAHLRKKDLQHGTLTYRRRKTGQLLRIKWEKCMQEITDIHLAECNSPYLLPILKYPYTGRNPYKNMQYRINYSLKEIAQLAGIPIPLTLYVARHSWASIAKSKNTPISVISEGMCHDSEATTQIYLASLDTSVVDRANTLILKDLM